MIKNLFLILAFLHYGLHGVDASEESAEVVANEVIYTNKQRFCLYATLYLDQRPTPKSEFFARYKTGDMSEADFELVTDNVILANLIEIIETMSPDEIHDPVIMDYLVQILECKNLEYESTIQHRKAYIIELLKQKNSY